MPNKFSILTALYFAYTIPAASGCSVGTQVEAIFDWNGLESGLREAAQWRRAQITSISPAGMFLLRWDHNKNLCTDLSVEGMDSNGLRAQYCERFGDRVRLPGGEDCLSAAAEQLAWESEAQRKKEILNLPEPKGIDASRIVLLCIIFILLFVVLCMVFYHLCMPKTPLLSEEEIKDRQRIELKHAKKMERMRLREELRSVAEEEDHQVVFFDDGPYQRRMSEHRRRSSSEPPVFGSQCSVGHYKEEGKDGAPSIDQGVALMSPKKSFRESLFGMAKKSCDSTVAPEERDNVATGRGRSRTSSKGSNYGASFLNSSMMSTLSFTWVGAGKRKSSHGQARDIIKEKNLLLKSSKQLRKSKSVDQHNSYAMSPLSLERQQRLTRANTTGGGGYRPFSKRSLNNFEGDHGVVGFSNDSSPTEEAKKYLVSEEEARQTIVGKMMSAIEQNFGRRSPTSGKVKQGLDGKTQEKIRETLENSLRSENLNASLDRLSASGSLSLSLSGSRRETVSSFHISPKTTMEVIQEEEEEEGIVCGEPNPVGNDGANPCVEDSFVTGVVGESESKRKRKRIRGTPRSARSDRSDVSRSRTVPKKVYRGTTPTSGSFSRTTAALVHAELEKEEQQDRSSLSFSKQEWQSVEELKQIKSQYVDETATPKTATPGSGRSTGRANSTGRTFTPYGSTSGRSNTPPGSTDRRERSPSDSRSPHNNKHVFEVVDDTPRCNRAAVDELMVQQSKTMLENSLTNTLKRELYNSVSGRPRHRSCNSPQSLYHAALSEQLREKTTYNNLKEDNNDDDLLSASVMAQRSRAREREPRADCRGPKLSKSSSHMKVDSRAAALMGSPVLMGQNSSMNESVMNESGDNRGRSGLGLSNSKILNSSKVMLNASKLSENSALSDLRRDRKNGHMREIGGRVMAQRISVSEGENFVPVSTSLDLKGGDSYIGEYKRYDGLSECAAREKAAVSDGLVSEEVLYAQIMQVD